MRKYYENQEDLLNEAESKNKIQQKLGGVVKKIPIKYGVDYVVINITTCQVVSFVEFKKRNYFSYSFQEYMISVGKFTPVINIGLPIYVFVKFKDGLLYWQFDKDQVSIRMGGRKDRNDWQDMEPCYFINMKHFSKV